jgi:hypothetical protein
MRLVDEFGTSNERHDDDVARRGFAVRVAKIARRGGERLGNLPVGADLAQRLRHALLQRGGDRRSPPR